jgi:hypothetical protein
VAASRWQGVAGALTRATGRAPGKAVEGQSSPEQRVATRREGTGRERGGSQARGKEHDRLRPPAVGRERRRCCANGGSGGARVTRRCTTDRWGLAAMGPSGQWQGGEGRGVSEAARWWGTDRRARPAECLAARFEYNSNSNEFELLQNLPIFDRSKNSLP